MNYLFFLEDEARSVVLAIFVDHWHGFLKGVDYTESER
jgi:hypothetical protein